MLRTRSTPSFRRFADGAVTSRESPGPYYWQFSAAGLLLGMVFGAGSGLAVAIYFGTNLSVKYASALFALPMFGVVLGAICGGAAGIAGSVYASHRGRPPHFLLTTSVSLVTAGVIGALLTGTALTAAIALPASVPLGLALPRVAERLRRSHFARPDHLEAE